MDLVANSTKKCSQKKFVRKKQMKLIIDEKITAYQLRAVGQIRIDGEDDIGIFAKLSISSLLQVFRQLQQDH